MSGSGDITLLLRAAATGDTASHNELYQSVYDKLYSVARSQRRKWVGNETINTTALINEAYLKLAPQKDTTYRDRVHFFATAARAMRQVLINYAERAGAAKRGGNALRLSWSDEKLGGSDGIDQLVQIDACLTRLEEKNERHARVFEYRVFGGMSIDDIAQALDVSTATVSRDWQFASAWVYACLQG